MLSNQDRRVEQAEAIITRFKSALYTRKEDVALNMWNDIPLLQNWYSGKDVNFANEKQPDVRFILLPDLITSFKLVLSCGYLPIIKAMWHGNTMLREWCEGKELNFSDDAEMQVIRSISLDELISIFKLALLNRYNDMIEAIWINSSRLQAWYASEEVNFNDNPSQQPDNHTISPTELISCFQLVLSSDCQMIMRVMWKKNNLLRSWYTGQSTYFGNDQFGQPLHYTILPDELIASFKIALSSRENTIVDAMWNANLLIRKWYCGERVTFANNKSGLPIYRTILPDELTAGFSSILSSTYLTIMYTIWKKNESLRALFCGYVVKYINDELEQSMEFTLAINELTTSFNFILIGRYLPIINEVWGKNALLRAWFSGQEVILGQDKFGQPIKQAIATEELITTFKNALTSRCPHIINDMWKDNVRLQHAIKINTKESRSLFRKVICCCATNNEEFIFQYLKIIDVTIVCHVLEQLTKLQNKTLSKEKCKQISVLETCLDKMISMNPYHTLALSGAKRSRSSLDESAQKQSNHKNEQRLLKKTKVAANESNFAPPTLFGHHFNLPTTSAAIPQPSSDYPFAEIDDYLISGWSP